MIGEMHGTSVEIHLALFFLAVRVHISCNASLASISGNHGIVGCFGVRITLPWCIDDIPCTPNRSINTPNRSFSLT
jgi:hypothetical protein